MPIAFKNYELIMFLILIVAIIFMIAAFIKLSKE
jgi:uncharacterized membrane protein